MARRQDIASGRANPIFDAIVRRQMHTLGSGAARLGAARGPEGQGALLSQAAVGSYDPREALMGGLGEQMEARRVGMIMQYLAEQERIERQRREARFLGAALSGGGALIGLAAGGPAGAVAGGAVGKAAAKGAGA